MLKMTLILAIIYVIFMTVWCYGESKWYKYPMGDYRRDIKYYKTAKVGKIGCWITAALLTINAIVQIAFL